MKIKENFKYNCYTSTMAKFRAEFHNFLTLPGTPPNFGSGDRNLW